MSANYTITGQHQTNVLDAAGHFATVIEVTFAVPGAGTGMITVPIDQYNAPRVNDLVSERVDHMEAVARLGSPG